MEEYNTGDIILCCYRGWKNPIDIFSHIIEWLSPLPYSHCGIFLKAPTYIDSKLTGNYVWESAIEPIPDVEDNIKKCGITITPIEYYLEKYDGSISVKRLLQNNKQVKIEEKEILDIQKKVYDKPYDLDPMDWIRELLNMKDPDPQKTNRFWCSAFVGYFLTKINALPEDTDWSIFKPADFAENDIQFQDNYTLGSIKVIKK